MELQTLYQLLKAYNVNKWNVKYAVACTGEFDKQRYATHSEVDLQYE